MALLRWKRSLLPRQGIPFSSNLTCSNFLRPHRLICGALDRAHERKIEERSALPGVLLLAFFADRCGSDGANVASIHCTAPTPALPTLWSSADQTISSVANLSSQCIALAVMPPLHHRASPSRTREEALVNIHSFLGCKYLGSFF